MELDFLALRQAAIRVDLQIVSTQQGLAHGRPAARLEEIDPLIGKSQLAVSAPDLFPFLLQNLPIEYDVVLCPQIASHDPPPDDHGGRLAGYATCGARQILRRRHRESRSRGPIALQAT